ncbi:MAG: response regulator [Gemmatimonadaceae bacterium]|jgi:two-component system KDP operon response regulator KdpE|nr:response regulator [Gemmatimonadaceae bacterium]
MTGRGTGPVVVLVEDEPQMRRFLRVALEAEGYRTVEAPTAAEGLQQVAGHNPELVLLDLGLPDGDGVDVTRQLRTWTTVPVIVLSARGQEGDKIAALDAGADDYLTKPFSTGELLARMRVALRRAERRDTPADAVFELDGLRVDRERRLVSVHGAEVRLTPTEYRLLALLVQHAGKVLTHRFLLAEVWGPGRTAQTHYLRVYMQQLREKLEADPARPRWLRTEPGVGYRLHVAS